MKYLLTVILFIAPFVTSAQMTHEYDFAPSSGGRMVQLIYAGDKYVICDNVNKEIRLYNLDSTLYKVMQVPQYTGYTNFVYPNWVSDGLFNNDALIEYTMVYYGSPDKYEVINEDGQVLNSVPGSNYGDVYIDADGNYKLVLQSHDENAMYVYGLPGFLPCNYCDK